MAYPTIFLIGLLLLPALSHALDSPRTDDTIEEIQVTATRRSQAVSDVSAAITLISEDEIAALKLTTDALAGQSGVFLQQTTPGQGAAIVRGLKGSELLHLVDGMRLNNAIFRNAPTQYLALVAPVNVERIEVLRGAPTSLYGSDAVGGVVHILSRVPRFDSASNDSRGTVMTSFDSGELMRSIGASVEVGNDTLAGLIGGSYLETGNRRTGGGERVGPSAYTSSSARVALSYTPSAGREWLVDYQFARQPETPRVDELVPGFGQAEPSSAEFFFAPNERHFAHLRYLHEDGALAADWRFDLGWQRIVDDRVTRNFGSDDRRLEANRSDLLGIVLTANRETDFGSWVAGAEAYFDEVSSRRRQTNLVTGETTERAPRFPDGATLDQAAVFANVDVDINESHRLNFGARVSSVDMDLPRTDANESSNISETDVSGDLGWIFDIDEQLQFTANVSYGFRAPNVFDVGTLGERPGNRFNVPNPDLGSEKVTHYDLGLRYRSQRSEASLVLYQLHYNDRITSVLTGEVTADGRDVVQSQNQSSADIRGAEASLTYDFSPLLSAEAVINYTWGEQSDGPADRIPPLNGRAGLRADFERLSLAGAIVFADRQDRLSARDIRDVRIDPNGTSGWGILNLQADWLASESLRASVRLHNVFDKHYRTHGSGIDAVGRNAILELNYAW